MKYFVLVLLTIFLHQESKAYRSPQLQKANELQLSSRKPSVNKLEVLVKSINFSLLESSKSIRLIGEKHADHLSKGEHEAFSHTCQALQISYNQFLNQSKEIENGFNNQLSQITETQIVFSKNINSQFAHIVTLTKRAIERCSDGEVLSILESLREKLMDTGFLVQSFKL